MADLYTIIDRMIRDRSFETVARNPLAQFGTVRRPLIGATLLPEIEVPENNYTEDSVRYRTVIALGSGRYSPSQKRGDGLLTGKFDVVLAESDIAREFTSRDYDALIRLIRQNQTMDAMLVLINWVDMVINRALVEVLELWRWQAINDASVVIKGDDDYTETVPYPNPAGSRVAAGGTWSSNIYDPYPDIIARADYLVAKGYTPSRIVTSRKVANILLKNALMKGRLGGTVTVSGSNIVTQPTVSRATLADLNGLLAADGLPPLELYDATYNTEAANYRFMADTTFTMISTTGRDESVLAESQITVVNDVLGYTAIGRAAGQNVQGRHIRVEAFSNKPPRVEAEGWQTGLPIITEPEAITVVTGIA